MSNGLRRDLDLEYASPGSGPLSLDLYRPDADDHPHPVVVYIHGGAWAMGDKADRAETRAEALARAGIAVASVNYRLSDIAPFPAQLHDVKGAVRWLRAAGGSFGLATDRIGAFGPSAGGHLAAMAGLTSGDPALEGTTGGNLDQSSAVQAVVDWYGPTDLTAAGGRNALEAALLGRSFEAKLLGVESVTDDREGACQASPRWHVDRSAPPFLLMHGDRDHIVPLAESATLHEMLVSHDVESTLVVLGGAGHDDHRFDAPGSIEIVAGFLRRHLLVT